MYTLYMYMMRCEIYVCVYMYICIYDRYLISHALCYIAILCISPISLGNLKKRNGLSLQTHRQTTYREIDRQIDTPLGPIHIYPEKKRRGKLIDIYIKRSQTSLQRSDTTSNVISSRIFIQIEINIQIELSGTKKKNVKESDIYIV